MLWLNLLIAFAVGLAVFRITLGIGMGLLNVWDGRSRGPRQPADANG